MFVFQTINSMKKVYLIVIIALLSCSKPIDKENQRLDKLNKSIQKDLKENIDKIVLLSTIKHIPVDTLCQILGEYYYKYDADTTTRDYQETIELISRKHKISVSKAAVLIYSFKYEMLTNEEIIDKDKQQEEDDREETRDSQY